MPFVSTMVEARLLAAEERAERLARKLRRLNFDQAALAAENLALRSALVRKAVVTDEEIEAEKRPPTRETVRQ
jgi:hypothetical protein